MNDPLRTPMQRLKRSNTMNDPLQGSCIVVYGPPKCGKTTLASSFPEPVQWITTEPGHRYIPHKQRKKLIRLTFDKTTYKGASLLNGWDLLLFSLYIATDFSPCSQENK